MSNNIFRDVYTAFRIGCSQSNQRIVSTDGNSTFIPKLAKCCPPLTIESRGSGSVNGDYNRRIYRKSGLRVPASSSRSSRCLSVFFFFLPFSLSLSLSLIFSTVHIVEQRTLLTEKERHESPRVTRRGREKLTQLQKSLAGGTGLDYQRRSCGRHGGACLSFQKFETRSTR